MAHTTYALSSVSLCCLDIFKKYLGKFQEIFSKTISSKIFENVENLFGKFLEVF